MKQNQLLKRLSIGVGIVAFQITEVGFSLMLLAVKLDKKANPHLMRRATKNFSRGGMISRRPLTKAALV